MQFEGDCEFEVDNDDNFFEGYVENIRNLALSYIKSFFHNKDMRCGGSIPKRMLFTPENLNLVLRTNVSQGVSIAYGAMEKCNRIKSNNNKDGVVEEDVKLVVAILNNCSVIGVPKCFAGGLMILCLKFCEGVKFES